MSVTNDHRATATLTVLQGADANDKLNAVASLGRATPLGLAVGPFYVRDRLGRTVAESSACWIQRRPNITMDRAPTSREWVFRLSQAEIRHGGNVRLD